MIRRSAGVLVALLSATCQPSAPTVEHAGAATGAPRPPAPSAPSHSAERPSAAVAPSLRAKPHAARPEALAAAAFRAPPPWPAHWCPSLSSVYSDELAKKHGLPGVVPQLVPACGPGVAWEQGGKKLGFGVLAGTSDAQFMAKAKAEAKFDPKLVVRVEEKRYGEEFVVRYWSDEPPFVLHAYARGFPPREAEQRARALALDVLPRLSAPAFFAPLAEVVVVYPEEAERARAAHAQWASIALAYDAIAPLPAGFPRWTAADSITWDPRRRPTSGKELLVLAVCPSGAGRRLIDWTWGLFPRSSGQQHDVLGWFLADASGLTMNCPSDALAGELPTATSVQWEQPDGSLIGLGSVKNLDAAAGAVAVHGAALLWDAAGLVRDYLPFELRKPEAKENVRGRFGHERQRRRVGACNYALGYDAASTARLVCESLWSDYRCDAAPEQSGTLLRFEVLANGRLASRTEHQEFPGRGCRPPE